MKHCNLHRQPIVGILGGMGPAATNYLYEQIITNTMVVKDQDHLHVVINSYSHIPDRTDAILGRGEDPLPYLIKGLNLLNDMSADFILMPCNTAHYYLPKLIKYTKANIIDMIKLTTDYIKLYFPDIKKVGLMATDGVIKTKIYEKYCKEVDLKVVLCNKELQLELMSIIYGLNGIKQGNTSYELLDRLKIVMDGLFEKGVEIFVLGCTEIPLLPIGEEYRGIPIVDPIKLLAKHVINVCGKNAKLCY